MKVANREGRKLGVCVRNDIERDGGPRYSIVWHAELFEVVVKQELAPGTWLLFTATGETCYCECKKLPLAKDVEITSEKRQFGIIRDTIWVRAQSKSIDCNFNEHFCICTDPLLGHILIGSDLYATQALKEGKTVEFAVAYLAYGMCSFPGRPWVSIAVYKPNLGFRIMGDIPRVLSKFASAFFEKQT